MFSLSKLAKMSSALGVIVASLSFAQSNSGSTRPAGRGGVNRGAIGSRRVVATRPENSLNHSTTAPSTEVRTRREGSYSRNETYGFGQTNADNSLRYAPDSNQEFANEQYKSGELYSTDYYANIGRDAWNQARPEAHWINRKNNPWIGNRNETYDRAGHWNDRNTLGRY